MPKKWYNYVFGFLIPDLYGSCGAPYCCYVTGFHHDMITQYYSQVKIINPQFHHAIDTPNHLDTNSCQKKLIYLNISSYISYNFCKFLTIFKFKNILKPTLFSVTPHYNKKILISKKILDRF